MDTVSVVKVAPDLYFVYGTHKNIRKNNKNPDDDTIDDNTSLRVTQEACVTHIKLLLQRTTRNMTSVKNISYQQDFGKLCMIRV